MRPATGTSRANGVTWLTGYLASSVFQIPYPSREEMYAVNIVLAMAVADRCVTALPMAPAPSVSSDNRSRGTGTTRPDQTTRDRPERARTLRARTLPIDHDKAAPRTRMSGKSGATALRPTATTTRPTAPTPTPSSSLREGVSPKNAVEIRTVRSTWACRTREVSPGGMPRCSAR